MPLTPIQHRRAHNLLLIKKLLDCRENASPLTLIIDSLKQSARPLLHEIVGRANKSRTAVIYLSWDTIRKPRNVDVFLTASDWDVTRLKSELQRHLKLAQQRTAIIFDTLNILFYQPQAHSTLPALLSSLISPSVSIFAVYHADVPVPHDPSSYSPTPLVLMRYLATSVLITHSLSHVVAAKEARERSVAEPAFGLAEEREGIVVGKGSSHLKDLVSEMEYRRKSGRAVHEVFVLSRNLPSKNEASAKGFEPGEMMLLDDHPRYKAVSGAGPDVAAGGSGNEMSGTTFSLELTDKQRRDREGIVLPYFDAQKDGGGGEGGRILYEMTAEDDFDEEEDEI